MFSCGLELLGNQFQQNLHFTEEGKYVKEHWLAKFPNIIETRGRPKSSIFDLM